MERKNDCLVCGAELEYFDTTGQFTCSFCHKERDSNVKCVNGHFICDGCHSLSAVDLIRKYCAGSDFTDPFEMADLLMRNPSVKMHGPEHHFLVPAVLLTAYYNIIGDPELKEPKLKEAEKRSSRVPGGFCGTHGNCGAAVGTGIFISLILDSTPLKTEEWGLCNRMTAESLSILGKFGGPRCCKRTTFLSLSEATKFLRTHVGINLGMLGQKACTFLELNRECIGDRCPFFPR